jgi:hypothetical protein
LRRGNFRRPRVISTSVFDRVTYDPGLPFTKCVSMSFLSASDSAFMFVNRRSSRSWLSSTLIFSAAVLSASLFVSRSVVPVGDCLGGSPQ